MFHFFWWGERLSRRSLAKADPSEPSPPGFDALKPACQQPERTWTLSFSAVGTSRCDVAARAAADGTNADESSGELRRWTRRGRRSAPSLPRMVSMCGPATPHQIYIAFLSRPVLNSTEANQTMPAMNAYLFSALTTRSQIRPTVGRSGVTNAIQTWDGCESLIVFGESPDEAEKRFEARLRATPEGENPAEVAIRKITAAQFVDQLFTESGPVPLNWPEILKQVEAQFESTPVDDFEQGYWLDVEQAVRPEKLSFSAGTLQSDLPEDIRSGLNWSADKQFLFVLSVLSPLELPLEQVEESEAEDANPDESANENSESAEPVGIGELYGIFPQALDKEAAALIRARNSAVAAWLWRRYAANTRLATNTIRIDPWCSAINLP